MAKAHVVYALVHMVVLRHSCLQIVYTHDIHGVPGVDLHALDSTRTGFVDVSTSMHHRSTKQDIVSHGGNKYMFDNSGGAFPGPKRRLSRCGHPRLISLPRPRECVTVAGSQAS